MRATCLRRGGFGRSARRVRWLCTRVRWCAPPSMSGQAARGRAGRRTDHPSRYLREDEAKAAHPHRVHCTAAAPPRPLPPRRPHIATAPHPRGLPLSPTLPARCQPPRDTTFAAAAAAAAATPPHRRTAASRPLLPSPSPVAARASISAAAGGAVRRPPLPSRASFHPASHASRTVLPGLCACTASQTDGPDRHRFTQSIRPSGTSGGADCVLERAGGPSHAARVHAECTAARAVSGGGRLI